jgi:hypothetical protein
MEPRPASESSACPARGEAPVAPAISLVMGELGRARRHRAESIAEHLGEPVAA